MFKKHFNSRILKSWAFCEEFSISICYSVLSLSEFSYILNCLLGTWQSSNVCIFSSHISFLIWIGKLRAFLLKNVKVYCCIHILVHIKRTISQQICTPNLYLLCVCVHVFACEVHGSLQCNTKHWSYFALHFSSRDFHFGVCTPSLSVPSTLISFYINEMYK